MNDDLYEFSNEFYGNLVETVKKTPGYRKFEEVGNTSEEEIATIAGDEIVRKYWNAEEIIKVLKNVEEQL